MESRGLCRLFFMLTWMFVFLLLYGCSGAASTQLSLDTRVFVALAGAELTIKCNVTKPAMTPKDNMTCFSPHNTAIYSCDIGATTEKLTVFTLELHLRTLNDSGEYYCQYQNSKAYWFLRVRDGGYTDPVMLDYTEVIILTFFTGVLLVFSVVGSVYVFRGLPKQQNKCDETRGKQKQKREDMKPREIREDNAEVTTASSTSVYASLEPRPGSIYDVLDCSAANRDSDQQKAKANKKQPQKTVSTEQTTQHQEEGVLESVYENF